MISSLKRIVDGSRALTHLNYYKGQLAYQLGLHRHLSGATHGRFDLNESLAYVRGVFDDYVRYSGEPSSSLAGKRVMEIGPGDNLGVGLLFLAHGGTSYLAVDRFSPQAEPERNEQIYAALLDGMTDDQRSRVADCLEPVGQGRARITGSRLAAQYGSAIEDLGRSLASESVDVIISRAVLEHVYDPVRAWQVMASVLHPDGQMWHKVDLRHHGFYDQFHPLEFLTVPTRIWDRVTQPDPTLNRRRVDCFDQLAKQAFQESEVYLTHVLDHEELVPHRQQLEFGRDYDDEDLQLVRAIHPRLAPEFRELSDEQLLVTGIFVICRRKRSGS